MTTIPKLISIIVINITLLSLSIYFIARNIDK